MILSGNVCTTCVLTSPPVTLLPLRGTLLINHFQTEAHLQRPWGNFEISGRVRISDGLVVLVRQLVGHLAQSAPASKRFLSVLGL